ncbi:MAG TPA: flagellar hook protein FlgE [Steroidobacteraceae bacterium]|jgi:flagellar hook protein FlgE|nr:flagellar hook protein FlgE [Steroidobacteraceae bacterium]
MPFRIALSGLNAASADLNVTANNIANTSTNGFKGSRTEFADLFAVSLQGVSSNSSGNGVRVAAVAQQFSQGNIEFTDSNLDLAVSGQGMFILSDNGALAYTRAGAYQMNRDGYVVNSQGQRLQVYPPIAGGGFNTGGLGDLRLLTTDSAPQATANVEYVLNLPASATPPPIAAFDPNDPNSFNQATSLTLFDSLGATHTGTMYFTKTVNPNEWTARMYIDGQPVGPGGTPTTLQYTSSGLLQSPAGGQLPFPAFPTTTGSAPLQVTVDIAQSTQFGGNFAVNSVTQDGYTTGRLIGIDISDTGVVNARFTNGNSQPLGQIAIANFANPQGLQQLGNTQWAETFASGQALRGQAGNSGFGLVQSGALEGANVDVTEQLVQMITAQRNFQANAQMISTADSITQTIINMR